MTYAIVGTGSVGQTLAGFFQKAGIEVALANRRGPSTVGPVAREIGDKVLARSLDEALEAEIIFFAVQFLDFRNLAASRPDWTGKIVVDVTNAAFLPQEVQDRELQGRLSSEVNAERLPGGKLVKAFNQLPMPALKSAVPAGTNRVVFIASDHDEASAEVASLTSDLGFAPIELGKIAEGGRLIQARNALVFQNLVRLAA